MAVGTDIWTYFEGKWHHGDIPVMKAADHATWLGMLVFDGARALYWEWAAKGQRL